jgi:hypothetical protein
MEISQENAFCSYLYLKKAKMSNFSFYLFSVFFYKTRKQEGVTGSALRGELVLVRGGGGRKKK